jgi:hypothetical protein
MISKNGVYEYRDGIVYTNGCKTLLAWVWVEYMGGGW